MSSIELQTSSSPDTKISTLPEVQPVQDRLDVDLLNVCLFVPQAFLARTPALTPPVAEHETVFQIFSRKLQNLSENNDQTERKSGAVDALQELYTALNQEVAESAPVTAADWSTINAVLFSETMAKIQTQPDWVISALLAPLAEKEAQYNSKKIVITKGQYVRYSKSSH